VLGAALRVECDRALLLKVVDAAFAGLPHHKLFRTTPTLTVKVRLDPSCTLGRVAAPPPLRFHAAAGLICATADAANYVIVAPLQRSALVVISRDMLRFPYHARYELLEFAAYTMVARCLGLVPVHAACISRGDKGFLLIGNSGAGKSTLAFFAMLAGLELHSEDAIFIEPRRMLATALPNFLHVQRSVLRYARGTAEALAAARAPTIVRRSGVEKLEIDLRRNPWRLSRMAVKIVGILSLSKARANGQPLLASLSKRHSARVLDRTQLVGRDHVGWPEFRRHALALPAYELARGAHPRQSADAVAALLAALA